MLDESVRMAIQNLDTHFGSRAFYNEEDRKQMR
jgi:hypothetical protein